MILTLAGIYGLVLTRAWPGNRRITWLIPGMWFVLAVSRVRHGPLFAVTAALGVAETAQVENIIRTLKQAGDSLILISHNMRQVFDLADRIVVFRRGRIAANLVKKETTGEEVVAYITGAKAAQEVPEAA